MDVPIGRPILTNQTRKFNSLNPCFNGCANRPILEKYEGAVFKSLNPCFNGCANRPTLQP